ncbi:complement receptor type 2-like [Protopterus annectens]|uniref:complement receptor type 2-like n=1 Tax=Protopterus annectens TaxID=7888 RepID=UPI001CFA8523|nr:complement receptor type 2-like [Protopterus annectens]
MAKTCAAPPEIVDGTVDLGSTSQDIAVGTVATYSCKKFQLIGNATIYCTKSGSWSGSPPVCKGANIGTNPKTTTEKKNENVDSPVAGGLAAKSPNGKDANCPEPQVAHGHKTGKSGPTYRSDDTIKFECEPGYWMNGHSTITCKDDNEWHPSPPTCDDEEDKEKKKRIIGLAVGIPLAVIVLAAIIVLIYYCCCLKKKEGK